MSSWLDRFTADLRRRWPNTHEVAGWRTRNNRTAWIAGGPIGALAHHTASSRDEGAVGVMTNGWSGFPGPVYNVLVLSTGAVHLIAAGPANHAGRGSGTVRDRIRAGGPPGATGVDTMNGNQSFFGISARHVGTNPNYPPAQIDALVAVGAAFCTARGLRPETSFHHREWTRRKIDMSWQGDLRARIRAAMGPAPPTPPTPTPDLLRWIMSMPGAPANLTFDQFLNLVADRAAARVMASIVPRHNIVESGVERAVERRTVAQTLAITSTMAARAQLGAQAADRQTR